MNVWRSGGPLLTAEKLLGPAFLGKDSLEFDNRKEWEEHKEDVQKMARFHSKILRSLKSGKREGKTVVSFREHPGGGRN